MCDQSPARAHRAVFKTLQGTGGGPGDDQRLQVTWSNERNQGDGEVKELLLPAEDHFLLFFPFFSFETVRAAGEKNRRLTDVDGVTHVNPVSHLKNAGGKEQTRKKKERKREKKGAG